VRAAHRNRLLQVCHVRGQFHRKRFWPPSATAFETAPDVSHRDRLPREVTVFFYRGKIESRVLAVGGCNAHFLAQRRLVAPLEAGERVLPGSAPNSSSAPWLRSLPLPGPKAFACCPTSESALPSLL